MTGRRAGGRALQRVSTLLFGVYVTHFANYSRVYGSLGTGVVLLLWLFLTALAVLCGAELNAELARDAVLQPMPAQPMPAELASPLFETVEREERSTHAPKGSR